MKDRYYLVLWQDGDITIGKCHSDDWGSVVYCDGNVYHKTLNPGEDVKDNLIQAYEEWERLEEGK